MLRNFIKASAIFMLLPLTNQSFAHTNLNKQDVISRLDHIEGQLKKDLSKARRALARGIGASSLSVLVPIYGWSRASGNFDKTSQAIELKRKIKAKRSDLRNARRALIGVKKAAEQIEKGKRFKVNRYARRFLLSIGVIESEFQKVIPIIAKANISGMNGLFADGSASHLFYSELTRAAWNYYTVYMQESLGQNDTQTPPNHTNTPQQPTDVDHHWTRPSSHNNGSPASPGTIRPIPADPGNDSTPGSTRPIPADPINDSEPGTVRPLPAEPSEGSIPGEIRPIPSNGSDNVDPDDFDVDVGDEYETDSDYEPSEDSLSFEYEEEAA